VSWFYVDDSFPDCPKLEDLPAKKMTACVGLWTLAGAWSRRNNAGGVIPIPRITKLGGTTEEADLLVECGLWERTEAGYQFHDWSDWQETPEEVAHKREQSAKRSKRWRDKRAASRTRHAVTHASATLPSRSENSQRTLSVPGEGEGTYKHEVRDTGTSDPDTLRAETALRALQAPLVAVRGRQ
jgi:hypothetical protein